jgi:hypothetical protein
MEAFDELAYPALFVILAAVSAASAAAHQRGSVHQGPHVLNPSVSPSAPLTSPLQAQLMLDYDAILIRKQHDRDLQQLQDQSDPQQLRNQRDRDLQQRNQSDPQRRNGY